MPTFIKSAIPGLSTRTAVVLQFALVAGLTTLALWPRVNEEPQIARASVPEAPTPQTSAPPQEASLGFSTIDVVVMRNDTMDRWNQARLTGAVR